MGDWLDAWALTRGFSVHWVTSQHEQCGVRNGYQDPSKLGADRWAALIAARQLVSRCGAGGHCGHYGDDRRADAAMGEFLGGLILARTRPDGRLAGARYGGIAAGARRVRAVSRGTRRMPSRAARFKSVCGAIERMQRALAARGAEPQILLSGGAAETLYAHLGQPARVVPNLVLEGLRVIAESEGER